MAILRVRTVLTGLQGGPAINTMYFAGPGSQSAADGAKNAVSTFWSSVAARMKTSVSWSTQADVAVVDEATGHTSGNYTSTPVTGVGGLTSGDLMPAGDQLVCNLHTGVYVTGGTPPRAHELRGKIYLPGFTENDNGSDGHLISTAITTVNSALSALVASTYGDLVVFSRKHLQAPACTGASVNPVWARLTSRRG